MPMCSRADDAQTFQHTQTDNSLSVGFFTGRFVPHPLGNHFLMPIPQQIFEFPFAFDLARISDAILLQLYVSYNLYIVF